MKRRGIWAVVLTLVVGTALVAAYAYRQHQNELRAKQAAAESSYATLAHDHKRAEALLAEAIRLKADFAEAWASHGMECMWLGQPELARKDYQTALALHEARLRRDPSKSNEAIQQVFVLTLLGRREEARAALEKAKQKWPHNSQVASFSAGLDKVRSDICLPEN